VFHRDVVNLGNIGGDMEYDKTHDVRPPALTFDFGDKTGGKAVVVEQAIVAVDGPMREVMPGPLDIDDAVDIASTSLTNSGVQCLQEQPPRPSCARIEAPTVRYLA